MFKWIRSRRPSRDRDLKPESAEDKRDSGEEEYASHEEDDQFFAHEGDIDAARELVGRVGPELGELFVYPGGEHLFLDRSLPTYDPDAAALVTQRTLHFLSVL